MLFTLSLWRQLAECVVVHTESRSGSLTERWDCSIGIYECVAVPLATQFNVINVACVSLCLCVRECIRFWHGTAVLHVACSSISCIVAWAFMSRARAMQVKAIETFSTSKAICLFLSNTNRIPIQRRNGAFLSADLIANLSTTTHDTCARSAAIGMPFAITMCAHCIAKSRRCAVTFKPFSSSEWQCWLLESILLCISR